MEFLIGLLNARRLAGGLLAVTAVAAIAVLGTSWFQEMSLQKDIDEKTMQCAGLDDETLQLESQLETLVTPLNEAMDRLTAEKTELDRKWSERIAAQASILRERAEGRVTATVRYGYTDLKVTVSNGSDYCLWRAEEDAGWGQTLPETLPRFRLFQGTYEFGEKSPNTIFWKNAEDKYGFSMQCLIPSGTRKTFDVDEPCSDGPGALMLAESKGLRLRGDFCYDGLSFSGNRSFVVDRVSPTGLHFYELNSKTSGNQVEWTASPVNWSSIAEKSLTNEDSERIAELSQKIRRLEADIQALPIRTDLAEARAVAGECRSALLDLTSNLGGTPAETPPATPSAQTPSSYSGGACQASAQARLESCLYGPESTWGRCRTDYLDALDRC